MSKTGASATGGTKFYPAFNWQVENNAKRTTFGLGTSYSAEYTYHSFGLNILFAKKSRDENREFTAKGTLFLDRVKMVEPSEFVTTTNTTTTIVTSASRGGTHSVVTSGASSTSVPSSSRNTFDASFALSQVVNQRLRR